MLYLISLGLYEKEDMSVKALEAAKKCDKLYLESYTHFFKDSAEELSKFIGKDVTELSREDVENESDKILEEAKRDNEWGEFLLNLYAEVKRLRSEEAFKQLARTLTDEDMKAIIESSKEFRERFTFR